MFQASAYARITVCYFAHSPFGMNPKIGCPLSTTRLAKTESGLELPLFGFLDKPAASNHFGTRNYLIKGTASDTYVQVHLWRRKQEISKYLRNLILLKDPRLIKLMPSLFGRTHCVAAAAGDQGRCVLQGDFQGRIQSGPDVRPNRFPTCWYLPHACPTAVHVQHQK